MAKVKYHYDPETLSYRKIERKKGRAFTFTFLILCAMFLCLIAGAIISPYFIETPHEKALKRENENLKLQYNFLSERVELAENALANVADRDENIYRIFFEANSISDAQRKAGFGGINRYKKFEGQPNSDLIKNSAKRIDILLKGIEVQSRSLDEIEKLAKDKEKLLAAIPAIQPVQNKDLTRVASGYGMRIHPILKYRKMHNGMDFTAPKGTPIYATGDGVVTKASRASGFGKVIYIDHGFGYMTKYAHLNKFNTRKGKKVKRGDIIGYVGNTGLSSGPHLHYEVHKNGKPINPVNFYHGDLSPEEYEIMLEKAAQENQSLD
ncbi:M23 family metallopeptidase [Pseudofulvibacter geojedonensis]|uniref:M23 family metallopeptidase n=1 Tax=Pseudofulvibacter geojedonensis TaxID=1123758 RepID=A0ABW3I1B6_9FLAO